VLTVGSGKVVQNLAHWRELAGTRPGWAEEFQARINAALLARDDRTLTELSPDDQAASLAVNSGEHYLPPALCGRRPVARGRGDAVQRYAGWRADDDFGIVW